MVKKYLIDTNVIIDFSANRLPEAGSELLSICIDEVPYISIITKIELLGFSLVTTEVKDLVKAARVIGLTDEIADQTILIRKHFKIKLRDAVIAATSIDSGLTLLSRNFSDFKKIKGLDSLDLFKL